LKIGGGALFRITGSNALLSRDMAGPSILIKTWASHSRASRSPKSFRPKPFKLETNGLTAAQENMFPKVSLFLLEAFSR